MNFQTFFEYISKFSDIVTLATVIIALRLAILKRKTSVLGFKINLFFAYLDRVVLIIFVWKLIYHLVILFYAGTLTIFKGNDNDLLWDDNHWFGYLVTYGLTFLVFLFLLWQITSVIWFWSLDPVKHFLNVFSKTNKFRTSSKSVLEIDNAVYGKNGHYIDVTNKVREMVFNNTLKIKATNDLAGDPMPGILKELKIEYKYSNKPFSISVNEGEDVILPKILGA